VGKLLLTVAVLMLMASHDAIAATNPSNEPSRFLTLACSGILTTTVPIKKLPNGNYAAESHKSDVNDVSVILRSNSRNIFTSLFDIGLPITSFERDHVEFDKTIMGENESIKYRNFGSVSNHGAAINEIIVLSEGVWKISFWYLHCNEGAIPPPIDRTPPTLPLIVPETPRS